MFTHSRPSSRYLESHREKEFFPTMADTVSSWRMFHIKSSHPGIKVALEKTPPTMCVWLIPSTFSPALFRAIFGLRPATKIFYPRGGQRSKEGRRWPSEKMVNEKMVPDESVPSRGRSPGRRSRQREDTLSQRIRLKFNFLFLFSFSSRAGQTSVAISPCKLVFPLKATRFGHQKASWSIRWWHDVRIGLQSSEFFIFVSSSFFSSSIFSCLSFFLFFDSQHSIKCRNPWAAVG